MLDRAEIQPVMIHICSESSLSRKGIKSCGSIVEQEMNRCFKMQTLRTMHGWREVLINIGSVRCDACINHVRIACHER